MTMTTEQFLSMVESSVNDVIQHNMQIIRKCAQELQFDKITDKLNDLILGNDMPYMLDVYEEFARSNNCYLEQDDFVLEKLGYMNIILRRLNSCIQEYETAIRNILCLINCLCPENVDTLPLLLTVNRTIDALESKHYDGVYKCIYRCQSMLPSKHLNEGINHNIQTCLSSAIPYLMRLSDNCPKGGKTA